MKYLILILFLCGCAKQSFKVKINYIDCETKELVTSYATDIITIKQFNQNNPGVCYDTIWIEKI